MPDVVHVLGCQMFQSALSPLLNGVALTSCRFMEYGLHALGQQMAPQVQAAIDSIEPPGRLLLGYGRCGTGIVGTEWLQRWAERAGRPTPGDRDDECVVVPPGGTAHPGLLVRLATTRGRSLQQGAVYEHNH